MCEPVRLTYTSESQGLRFKISSKCTEFVFLALYKTSIDTHGYISDKIIFKRFRNVLQLFKDTPVFFMGTVVRRCSVGDTKLEKGKQFCLLQRAAKRERARQNGASWREVQCKGGVERETEMKIECKRESKSIQRKVLLPATE